MTAFTRFLPMQFETTPDGDIGASVSPDGGGDAPDVQGGDVCAAAAAPPAPDVPASEPFDFDAYLETEEGRQEFAARSEQFQAAQTPPETPDDFSDIAQLFEASGLPAGRFDAFLESRLGPISQASEQLQYRQSEQVVNAQLAALPETSPELFGVNVPEELATNNRDLLCQVALGQQAQARENDQPYDVGQSFASIAQKMATRDKSVSSAAVEAYKKELEAAAGRPQSPVGSGSPGVEAAPAFSNEGDFARDFAQRNGITQ